VQVDALDEAHEAAQASAGRYLALRWLIENWTSPKRDDRRFFAELVAKQLVSVAHNGPTEIAKVRAVSDVFSTGRSGAIRGWLGGSYENAHMALLGVAETFRDEMDAFLSSYDWGLASHPAAARRVARVESHDTPAGTLILREFEPEDEQDAEIRNAIVEELTARFLVYRPRFRRLLRLPDPGPVVSRLTAEARVELARAKAQFSQSTDSPPSASGPDKEGLGLALLVKHPDWSNAQIAREVGVHRATVGRWKTFKAARAAQRADRNERPRGAKSSDGRLEAWDGPSGGPDRDLEDD
jgi:hypothetical protein